MVGWSDPISTQHWPQSGIFKLASYEWTEVFKNRFCCGLTDPNFFTESNRDKLNPSFPREGCWGEVPTDTCRGFFPNWWNFLFLFFFLEILNFCRSVINWNKRRDCFTTQFHPTDEENWSQQTLEMVKVASGKAQLNTEGESITYAWPPVLTDRIWSSFVFSRQSCIYTFTTQISRMEFTL